MPSPASPNRQDILKSLEKVHDPELKRNLVELEMIRQVTLTPPDTVTITVTLTTPACPMKSTIRQDIETTLQADWPALTTIRVEFDAKVPTARKQADRRAIEGVRNIIAVTSGKGGVGKSTISLNVAVALARSGARVGLCDCDIYGPNIPLMVGLSDRPSIHDKRVTPHEKFGMKIMSMGFLVPPDTPIIWRGPMIHSVIRQFLFDVEWGELDYLILDLPPGTGDAQLSIVQSVPITGGVIVTTPQSVSLQDARKGTNMFRQLNVPILGVIENMSWHTCPDCGHKTYIFGQGGGAGMAAECGTRFLGELPLGEAIRRHGDDGEPIVAAEPDHPLSQGFQRIASELAAAVSVLNSDQVAR